MKNLFIRFVFDRKRQASETKKGVLQIGVRKEGTNKRAFISTGIKLYKNQFSDRNSLPVKTTIQPC
ncbi:MAG: hypothetical protein LBP83_01460 [Dysgonamonadaceae bacterium]|jgi:hypothetical protein|nr:hypothetical protein [Dysgonamonadaceae bacterium]